MYMTMASVAPGNVSFTFSDAATSDVRELSEFEIDAVGGGVPPALVIAAAFTAGAVTGAVVVIGAVALAGYLLS